MRWLGTVGGVLFALASLRAQTIAREIEAAEALGARTGVVVCDGDGRILWKNRATEAFAPASNMKLLTAAACIAGLGAEHAFETTFSLRSGRLAVIASGDPNWIHDSVHAPEVVFGEVAAALRRLGVKTIAGIELDRGTFVGPDRPADWPPDQLYTYYCAPTGPFVLEQGTLLVAIDGAGGGADAHVELVAPPADLPLRGAIALVDAKKGATYGASDVGDAVLVRGKFPRRSPPVQIRSAVRNPAVWFEASLRRVLTANGISLGGDPGVRDQVVHTHRSELRQALLRMLEDSSNFDAEQCLRVLGDRTARDGSLAGGLAAMHSQLEKLVGRIPEGVVLRDGSGLSKDSRVTPGLLLVAMYSASRSKGGALLRDCLPVSGQSGTLADRFVGTPLVGRVHAKTGWIRGVSSLSGLVVGRSGTVRWFSILMNYDPKTNGLNKDLKAAQERIVAAIDAMDVER